MKCFFHPASNAVGICHDCKIGMCEDCASRFAVLRCQSCVLQLNRSMTRQMRRDLSVTLAIFTICAGYAAFLRGPAGLESYRVAGCALGLFFACTYWTWQYLSLDRPRI